MKHGLFVSVIVEIKLLLDLLKSDIWTEKIIYEIIK